jgi:dihydropteroate synthase
MLIGVSRKSFIGNISGVDEHDRLAGSLACTALAAEAGVQIFRTHDVTATLQALRVTEAILARKRDE